MLIVLIITALVGMSNAGGNNFAPESESYSYCECRCYEYRVYCTGLTWPEALAFCENIPGGSLATIDTQETFNNVKALIPAAWKGKFCGWGFWIGLSDKTGTPHPDNEAIFKDQWEIEMPCYYYEWSKKEPNDNNNLDPAGQNCVQMWYRRGNDGAYDDDYCGTQRHKGFVCQIDLNCDCETCGSK